MRTNVIIDDQLMSRAMQSGDYDTKRAAIEAGLRLLIQVNSKQELRCLRGRISWDGNLDETRRD